MSEFAYEPEPVEPAAEPEPAGEPAAAPDAGPPMSQEQWQQMQRFAGTLVEIADEWQAGQAQPAQEQAQTELEEWLDPFSPGYAQRLEQYAHAVADAHMAPIVQHLQAQQSAEALAQGQDLAHQLVDEHAQRLGVEFDHEELLQEANQMMHALWQWAVDQGYDPNAALQLTHTEEVARAVLHDLATAKASDQRWAGGDELSLVRKHLELRGRGRQ
jgi:flagellar biosynthesis chaperone FliJ